MGGGLQTAAQEAGQPLERSCGSDKAIHDDDRMLHQRNVHRWRDCGGLWVQPAAARIAGSVWFIACLFCLQLPSVAASSR